MIALARHHCGRPFLYQQASARNRRVLSSASASLSTAPPDYTTHRRVSRTLYRQLLRWCQLIERYDIPKDVIAKVFPAATVEAPDYVDAYRVELLSAALETRREHNPDTTTSSSTSNEGAAFPEGDDDDDRVVRKVARLLPNTSACDTKKLQVEIQSIADLRRFIQAIFRLNNVPTIESSSSSSSSSGDANEDFPSHLRNDEINRLRRDITFDKLRSLNELHKTRLRVLTDRHQRNADRTGVLYRIGEVVQHRSDRWRGVVTAWERGVTNQQYHRSSSGNRISDDFGSLTSKSYPLVKQLDSEPSLLSEAGQIRYAITLDVGDAYTLTATSLESSSSAGHSARMKATQNELQAVTDEQLTRIHNDMLYEAFTRYDSITHSFVANDIMRYEFPSDQPTTPMISVPIQAAIVEHCRIVNDGVRDLARQLDSLLLDTMKQKPGGAVYSLRNTTTTLWRILKRVALGEVFPENAEVDKLTPTAITAFHIRALMDVLSRILDAMLQRRLSMESFDSMQFRVGDVVRHKKFGFRGVVVGWDATPSMDVSRWDGVQDIENVMELPFYTIVPDKGDCIDAFGGERGLRYVCQVNLEACPHDQRILQVDLGSGWLAPTPSEAAYTPPISLSFAYGANLNDEDKAVEASMTLLENRINDAFLTAQDTKSSSVPLALTNLVQLLQWVDNLDDAVVVQDAIKEIRKANAKLELKGRLDKGAAALVAGRQSLAKEMYEAVVAEDPNYAEAWNKLGMFRYGSADHEGAVEALEKALALDGINFQAMTSMGLIAFDEKDYSKASEWFRKSLALDPWSMASTRLSACLDLIERENSD
jgi:hemimethylated DNA binding protein